MDIVNLEILLTEIEPLIHLDGIMTDDEEKILIEVKRNIKKFSEEYEKAWADNKLSKDEKKYLTKLWNNIYDNTLKTARKDNNVTAEEFQVLIQILKTIITKK
ncbi:MAG: hypothetical protein HeimC3_06820 [Candidatus Heimdallarchaeota archaeon LC_3]|nr:MAG: hypothetical protein HeimC3_06820 [Candidatus Heimdallarchaeota archaeon LC_3]